MKTIVRNCLFLVLVVGMQFYSPDCSAAAEQERIGKVQTVKGLAAAVNASNHRTLTHGKDILVGDTLVTAEKSFLQVMFLDGTVLSLGEKSELELIEIAYSVGDSENRAFKVDMLSGTCRFLTGKIAKYNPEAFSMESPLGVIGIRGTEGGVRTQVANPEAMAAYLNAKARGTLPPNLPGVPPVPLGVTVSHFNGSVTKDMSFTDNQGKQVNIPKGSSLDVHPQTGAGQPRDISEQDRNRFRGSSFDTSVSTPPKYSSAFGGFEGGGEIGGGNNNGSIGGGTPDSHDSGVNAGTGSTGP